MDVESQPTLHSCGCSGSGATVRPLPHSPPRPETQVRNVLAGVRRQFPGAAVRASTFDAFVGPLSAAVASGLRLPVVTQEVGSLHLCLLCSS